MLSVAQTVSEFCFLLVRDIFATYLFQTWTVKDFDIAHTFGVISFCVDGNQTPQIVVSDLNINT